MTVKWLSEYAVQLCFSVVDWFTRYYLETINKNILSIGFLQILGIKIKVLKCYDKLQAEKSFIELK